MLARRVAVDVQLCGSDTFISWFLLRVTLTCFGHPSRDSDGNPSTTVLRPQSIETEVRAAWINRFSPRVPPPRTPCRAASESSWSQLRRRYRSEEERRKGESESLR